MASNRRKVTAREGRARRRRIATRERLEPKSNESALVGSTCPRCGNEVPRSTSGRGRPRVWCSHRCRRAAYEERRAAANGAIAIEVVARHTEPPWDETIARVLASPVACRKVVRELSRRLRDRELGQPQWEGVLAEILSLEEAARPVDRHDATVDPGASW